MNRLDVYRQDRIKYLSLFAGSLDKTRSYVKGYTSLYDRSSHGEVSITYEQGEYGRFHPTTKDSSGLAMTTMPREVRNWLAIEGAVDIDIINAAPSVILEICHRHDIACVAFHDFVEHYEAYRGDVEDIKHTKNMILFDSHDLPTGSTLWARRMRNERKIMVEELRHYYPDILTKAMTNDEEKRLDPKRTRLEENGADGYVTNVDGLFLSYLYMKEEGLLLQAMDTGGRTLGMWDDAVSLIHDGMMVHRPMKDIDLLAIEGYVFDATGVHIKLAIKPMTPMLDIDPTKMPDTILIRDGHLEAAKYLCMAVGDYYLCDQYGEYVKANGTWSRDKDTIKSFFLRTCMGMNMKRITVNKEGEEKESLFSSMTEHGTSIIKAAKPLLGKSTIDDFSKQVVLGTEGKLFFHNGAWDFDKNTFLHADPTDTMRRIVGDFPPRIQDDIDFVFTMIIKPIFDTTEEGTIELFLQAVARAMAGRMDKTTYIVFGPRNSGKSILFQLVSNSFGNYVGTIPSASFAVGGGGGGDAYRGNGFMVDMECVRLVKMSELPPDSGKAKVKIDGSKIKIFQSMKEGVQARALHQMQRTFYSLGTGFFLLNDVPEFSPADSFDQCMLFELPNQFVSPDLMPLGPPQFWTHDDVHKRIAVPDVEKWIQEPRVSNAFLHIVLEAYKDYRVEPLPSMMDFKTDMAIGTGDDAYEAVIEVTMEHQDVVLITDLRDALAAVGIKDNNAVIGRTMARLIGNRFSAERQVMPNGMKTRILNRGDPNYMKTVYHYVRLVRGRGDNTVGIGGDNPQDNMGGGGYARGFVPNPR